ncbi:hypothetical protein E4U41_001833, partial [Claviceps citrina]
MAPCAVPQQDVNLTASAIQCKEAAAPHVLSNGSGGGSGTTTAVEAPAPLDASRLTYTLSKSPRA